MRRLAVAAGFATAGVVASALVTPLAADVLITVSKTSQRMSVLVDGSPRYQWPVSTGRGRYGTPSGAFQAQWMARKWRSKQYQNAPMPYSIFFHNGYAVHGTTEIYSLGRAASHGCVRLHPENAAKLFSLVQNQLENTRIVVSDDVLDPPAPMQPPKKQNLVVAMADIDPVVIEPPKPPVVKDVMKDGAVEKKRDLRETREPREAREPREWREARDAREAREQRSSRYAPPREAYYRLPPFARVIRSEWRGFRW